LGITIAASTLVGPSKERRVELIVDTGSILTWVLGKRLNEIGSKPRREKEFRTIEGRVVRRRTGPATIRHDGAEADIEVVFARETDAEVLGVTALESLGFQVDPVSKELHRSTLLAL
jgi:predicted aspartyl protease